ncbi:MAG: cytochrome c maturation protein CcmE [Cytophagales bacterium]|nr:cytochrome c maturation protein CcmE [Cytophagales bacterium]MDW8384999.1 cytochrome c maturation protein CcmE [Flammeovirgaceae bacterium]
MKISHIIGLIVIAIAVSIIISTAGDASRYVSFQEALEMEKKGDDSKVHVVGTLKRNEQGKIIGVHYEPTTDPNKLSFILVDENNYEQLVIASPPASMQDFYRSEKIVVEGRCKNGQFYASKILMKCPSKYEEKELKS